MPTIHQELEAFLSALQIFIVYMPIAYAVIYTLFRVMITGTGTLSEGR